MLLSTSGVASNRFFYFFTTRRKFLGRPSVPGSSKQAIGDLACLGGFECSEQRWKELGMMVMRIVKEICFNALSHVRGHTFILAEGVLTTVVVAAADAF